VICFNFRTDRCREITQVLTQIDLPDHGMKKLSLDYTTMTEYDRSFKNIHIIFSNENLKNTLGEVLEQHHLKQIRIAETEKYPHVTFFFSGGREIPFEGEKRILIPSPKVATYDLKPEMSAYEVTDALPRKSKIKPRISFASTLPTLTWLDIPAFGKPPYERLKPLIDALKKL